MKIKLLILLAVLFLFSSCGVNKKDTELSGGKDTLENSIYEEGVIAAELAEEGREVVYHKISALEAFEIITTTDDFLILDVRTKEEYTGGHIENAMLIPDFEIAERAEAELTDKDVLILIYCRSGRRSKIAAMELINMGYTNIYDFGGIVDWPYEIVSE